MNEDYRSLILRRLKARDRNCAQFKGIFSSYDSLSESFTHLLTKNPALRPNRYSSISSTSNEEISDEIENLKQELADVYKKKAINDQQLIEAKTRIVDLETNISTLTVNKDNALKTIEGLSKELKEAQFKIFELNESLQLMGDENIALLAANNGLTQKYLQVGKERDELLTRYKELKEKEILLINDRNEWEHQKIVDKMRKEIADASSMELIEDAKEAEGVGGVDTTPKESSSNDFYGDYLPADCRIKFECNEVGEINDVLFHQNGQTFFAAGADAKIKMFEPTPNACIKRASFVGANQAINRIDLDLDGKLILGACNEGAIRLWGVDDQRQRCAFTGHTSKVSSARFYNGGRSIASGSGDRTVKLWDITHSRCTKTYLIGSSVLDICSNDRLGFPAISAHYDKTVRFWDGRTNDAAYKLMLNGKVTSLFVSPDSNFLLCSTRDEMLTLLDFRSYSTIHLYSAEQYRTASDNSRCIMSPGGTYVAAGSADGQIFIWNTMNTRLEKILQKGGDSAVLSMAWHPSGKTLISGDKRKTLCLWR